MIFAAGMGALIMPGSASCSADNKSQTQKKEDETVRRERVAVERGNSHFAHGDYADALDQYNSAIEANPQSKVARFNRAMALSQLISDEERDQLLQPDSLRVPNTMREQAIKAYSDFTGTPSDTTYYTNSNYNLGNLYYSDGKYFYDKDSIQNAMSGGMAAMAGGSMQDYRKHAVETLEESVAAYKRTLNLEPERMEARENLRLAQILLDKLKDDNGGGQNNDQQQTAARPAATAAAESTARPATRPAATIQAASAATTAERGHRTPVARRADERRPDPPRQGQRRRTCIWPAAAQALVIHLKHSTLNTSAIHVRT